MDWSQLGDALSNGASTLIGTAATFGSGAIASGISGNPYYSNDPAAAGYAQGQYASSQTGIASRGTGNILVLGILGLIIYKLFK